MAKQRFGVIGACVCVLVPFSVSWVGYQGFFDSYREIIVNHEEFVLYRNFMREINRHRHIVDADPSDREAWITLGKAHQLLGDYSGSAAAFQQANTLMPLPPDLRINWAQSMFMGDQSQFSPATVFLLQETMKEVPGHPEGGWLMGLYHFQNKDYPAALQLWQDIATSPDVSAETRDAMNGAIAQLQERLVQGDPAPDFSSSPDKDASQLVVVVEIDEELRSLWQQDSILLVYVQDKEGSRIPRAVKRLSTFSLPLKVVLSDRDAMLPSSVLSVLEKGVVTARISPTGSAFAEAGDLYGQANIDPPKIEGWKISVHVVINLVKK